MPDKRIYYVWDNTDYSKAVRVPEPLGVPKSHHMSSTPLDNLIELAGRCCYDSFNTTESRSTDKYHQHIIEVGHGSVQEHANIVFRLEHGVSVNGCELLSSLVGRPGVYATGCPAWSSCCNTIVANVRAIREWGKWPRFESYGIALGYALQDAAKAYAPKALADIPEWHPRPKHLSELFSTRVVSAELPEEEIWASLFFTGISRGLSHELVRHKFMTAVSQRSTRYCDEDDSPWIPHPLIRDNILCMTGFGHVQGYAQSWYRWIKDALQSSLIERNVDKHTARKQARGAARGILGNALETELVFSASLAQWRHMLKLRANPAADDEIHEVFDEVREVLNEHCLQFSEASF